MDYRNLCIELFGTDDVTELRLIAEKVKTNARGAGRKKKFTYEEVQDIREQIENGMTVNEAAAVYGTSRQVISRYINETPPKGYTLRMTYMYKQYPCTTIDVNFLDQKIRIQNKTKDPLHRAFGVVENPQWDDFEYFIADRCFPESRGNAKEILKELQLDSYDPLQIIEKTGGRMAEDNMWIRMKYYPENGGFYEIH